MSGWKMLRIFSQTKFDESKQPKYVSVPTQDGWANDYLCGEGPPTDISPDSGINELAGMSPEDQEKQKEEWANELAKLEEEIQDLRFVLASKVKEAQSLKRKLGFSVWREFQDDMSQGIKNVKESNVYQKTESVIKATTEKTTSLLGGIGSGISSKLGQLKNSESFRSFEEKVGTAYENVKTRVVTSRSNSMQNFDEAVRESESRRNLSTASTPTISEEHRTS